MRCCLDKYIDVCVYNNMWISGTEQTCPGNYWCTYYRLSIDIPTTQRDRISSLDEKFLFSSSSAEQGWLDRFSHDTHYVFVVFEGESISISERFQINLSLQALFIRPLKNTSKMSSMLHKVSSVYLRSTKLMLTNHKQLLHRVSEDIMVDKIIVNHHSWTLYRTKLQFWKSIPHATQYNFYWKLLVGSWMSCQFTTWLLFSVR